MTRDDRPSRIEPDGAIDPVTLEVLRNHYQAIVENMARIMERTAYTTFVKETADFSTGLVSPGGEYVAYPWHLGASSYLGLNMKSALEYFEAYEEGDVVIANDAYMRIPPVQIVQVFRLSDARAPIRRCRLSRLTENTASS